MTTAISVSGLNKSFGSFQALRDLELEVAKGEVHGFLGPNGSGKSTTIRVLLGLLRADSGSISLLGGDPWSDSVELHKRLAYVPGDVSLWPNLSGGEVIDLLGRLRGGTDASRRDALLERFELDPTKKGKTYSKGNRQKVALVAALSSNAELLIMDEPTSGLDPLMESVFQDCVRERISLGTTVLLSSHILAEVESLCDRVTIIRDGHTVQTGSLDSLRVRTRTTIQATTVSEVVGLDSIAGVHSTEATTDGASGNTISLSVEPSALATVMQILSAAGITSITSSPPTLEELFMRHYETSSSAS